MYTRTERWAAHYFKKFDFEEELADGTLFEGETWWILEESSERTTTAVLSLLGDDGIQEKIFLKGGLRVYVKPESHVFGELPPAWVLYGDQGNRWLRGNITLPHISENFQWKINQNISTQGLHRPARMYTEISENHPLTRHRVARQHGHSCERHTPATDRPPPSQQDTSPFGYCCAAGKLANNPKPVSKCR
ncbi:hypothetical protein AVEN_52942-1 [Araneus ventricosus]|uniref:Uncharacterized protein n=1 Tax=Araneus ventricosus TaxID=182803 RepID=A0A4Y2PIG1_ARAVE|nr:hypothetical protein AVEN_52942-1 [Araneus ventricosus]